MIKKVVPDSSVIVKWVSKDKEAHLEQADGLLLDVQKGTVELLVPELAKYEVGNALLKKGINLNQAFQSIGTVYSLPLHFIPETESLANETFQMASEARAAGVLNLTYYDASFTALAKQEEAILVSDNPKHQAKIPGVKVVPLSDYK